MKQQNQHDHMVIMILGMVVTNAFESSTLNNLGLVRKIWFSVAKPGKVAIGRFKQYFLCGNTDDAH